MNCDGEKVVLVGLYGRVVLCIKPEIRFRVELHEDITGPTLRSLSWRKIELSHRRLRIIPYDPIVVHERERPRRHRSPQNNIHPRSIITLIILLTKIRQRNIHQQRRLEMYYLRSTLPSSEYVPEK